MTHRMLRAAVCAVALFTAGLAWAQVPGMPAVTATPGPGGSQTYALSLQTLLFLTSLAFLPAVLLMMTGFTRIIIVLSLMRQALGTPTAPPNQVLIGLALFLTLFVMAPVLERVHAEAWVPYTENRIGAGEALERASVPVKAFMMRQTRAADLALFLRLSRSQDNARGEDVPLKALIPAFITSELKTAFQIAFLVFIPFLIIDMVVSSVLMSMGMMMLSPVIISLPFKLMLFVLADGWNLLIGSLAQSFGT
ncbi:MAG: flagellar type III secretion system pore protein FliP [Burkholderiales bacterium]|nr:flagellar type III secretion system pore protein FliP [Burkholderiales bacterium]